MLYTKVATNQNTHFMYNNPKIAPFFEMMWKNIAEPDRPGDM